MSCLYFLLLGLLFAVLNNATAALVCGPGYDILHDSCVDENECEEENPRCGENAVCFNTEGSYFCQCATGFQTTSGTVNFTLEKGVECEDINECRGNKAICGPNAKCSNVIGSYYCMCDSGFMVSTGQERFNASQSVTCRDINECLESNTLCGPNADCTNTNGSYFCTCHSGFVTSNFAEKFNSAQKVTCNDINECLENSICGPNADCTNKNGSYFCTCHSGFVASNVQEKFNATQKVTCNDARKSSDSKSLYVPDSETTVYCTDVESSARQQQFNPTVLMFLLAILWILMFFQ